MKETDEVVQPIEEDVKTVQNQTVNTRSIPVSVLLVRQGQHKSEPHTHESNAQCNSQLTKKITPKQRSK